MRVVCVSDGTFARSEFDSSDVFNTRPAGPLVHIEDPLMRFVFVFVNWAYTVP